ncbi:MAG: NADP-dependent isocitrate dehydrogenase [Candidatus Kapabacteria bacterium]|nr:NADP-dependent isocitrate dehydrogenase [Candidatus Kapabacteria bacterium]
MKQTVTLIKGDGIGNEIADAVIEIFEAATVPVEWETAEAGLACYEKNGVALPQSTLNSIIKNKVALKGPTTTPIGAGHKSVNVTIRKSLELFANVRPAKSFPGIQTRFNNVNILIVRENIEDTYSGIEHMQTPDVAQCLKVITRSGSMSVMRYTFELARSLGRKRVTCVHKANIHKISDGLFLECFREVAKEYPDLQSDDIIVDNVCMQLVTRPEQFDVLVLPNLYGDIVSDLCAGLIGGLGVAPGGNIGNGMAVFEAVHGSAPDIAGKGLANPTALLLSSIQMLEHLGLHSYAVRIEEAMRLALVQGIKTRDLGGNATTREFTKAIIANLPRNYETPHDEAPKQVNSMPVQVSKEVKEWKPVGVDVFVQWDGDGVVPMPKESGAFTLTLISSRGTKVYPGEVPNLMMVNWFRCRYTTDAAITQNDVANLLTDLYANGVKWMHCEMLFDADGAHAYSKAQGE